MAGLWLAPIGQNRRSRPQSQGLEYSTFSHFPFVLIAVRDEPMVDLRRSSPFRIWSIRLPNELRGPSGSVALGGRHPLGH